MKKVTVLFLFFALMMPTALLWAQKNTAKKKKPACDITFQVQNAQDSSLCLTILYNGKYIIKDTAERVAPGKYRCVSEQPLQEGFYSLISNSTNIYLSFIMPSNQEFSVSLDTTGNIDHVLFKNSPENDEMLRFQYKVSESQARLTHIKDSMAANKGNEEKVAFYRQQQEALNSEMIAFIKDLIAANPEYLFSKMQKSNLEIELPQADSANHDFLPAYYRAHYWDNVDLADSRLIFTPTFEPKVKDYFGRVLQYQDVDTINKYLDLFIEKAAADTLMYRYCVDWTSRYYETSKYIGQDAVFVHLVKQNHLKGKCTWIDESLLQKYRKRVEHIEPLLIGTQSVELRIPDTLQSDDFSQWISSYSLPKEYVILWFYDPDCPKCNKQTALLKQLYDSLENAGTRNFDVYGVGNDSDVERWIRYVREKKLPWYNVGGNKANVDYLQIYNIYESGNPSMFILNKKRQIILNRSIEIMAIPEFLKQYEKIEQKKLHSSGKE